MEIRKAQVEDAPVLAQLVNAAGEGLPAYFWRKLLEGDPELAAEYANDPWALGTDRQRGKVAEGQIDVIALEGRAVAALTGYAIAADPEPIPEDVPSLFRPLLELEAEAAPSWYVNVLATLPEHRSKGAGARLLARAAERAREAGLDRLSLIAADQNHGALRLYERTGFVEATRRPMEKEDWRCDSDEWILMLKPL